MLIKTGQFARNVSNIIAPVIGRSSSNGTPQSTGCRDPRPDLMIRRGPTKGYIEVLENRLHETETVLLRVLSQISDAQLASTLSRDQSNNAIGYAPFSRLGKKGIEYWMRYPLVTAENVREWQQDCAREMSGSADEQDRVHPEPSTSSAMRKHVQRYEQNQSNVGARGNYDDYLKFESRTAPSEVSLTVHTAASPPLRLQENVSTGQSRKRRRSAGTFLNESSILNSPKQADAHHTSQKPSLWTGAPPINFQKQFLW